MSILTCCRAECFVEGRLLSMKTEESALFSFQNLLSTIYIACKWYYSNDGKVSTQFLEFSI
jgi:hypothetical protein